MTQTPENPDTGRPDGPGDCRPLHLDFDRLAAFISEGADKLGPIPAHLRTVEHAITHLRDETGLSDKQLARVLLTAHYVLTGIVRDIGPKWTTVACANWLGLCGQRLWDAEDRLPLRTRLANGLGLGHRTDHGQDDPAADAQDSADE
ncbi:hypothetical protein KGA66_06110 [Actinocrinis puniceicyclus]|uniref:Uncharacterized protein n=1 Tax=Actinocrinis puniceicyclus TaxID=977794 RepID=A0A8J7WJR9_9ACTN|nr:hypothetical protein [Actinocrinis puniceicyclus]MBS2962613.1 hypothetical protein [Actinocrinis puniceicyclus]